MPRGKYPRKKKSKLITQLEASLKEVDLVNNPPHYTFSKFDIFAVLLDWFPVDPVLWQVCKYLARANHKGNKLQDLEKAEWYLKRAIQLEKNIE